MGSGGSRSRLSSSTAGSGQLSKPEGAVTGGTCSGFVSAGVNRTSHSPPASGCSECANPLSAMTAKSGTGLKVA